MTDPDAARHVTPLAMELAASHKLHAALALIAQNTGLRKKCQHRIRLTESCLLGFWRLFAAITQPTTGRGSGQPVTDLMHLKWRRELNEVPREAESDRAISGPLAKSISNALPKDQAACDTDPRMTVVTGHQSIVVVAFCCGADVAVLVALQLFVRCNAVTATATAAAAVRATAGARIRLRGRRRGCRVRTRRVSACWQVWSSQNEQ